MTNKPLFLAPMAGVTDWPFRVLCFENGCDGATTEMISAMGLYYAKKEVKAITNLMRVDPAEGPVAVQIFGKEPVQMGLAAARMTDTGRYVAVDINMGCPARKVACSGEGSGLMRNLPLAGEIITAVKKNTTLPVTVKMRLGWDTDCINAAELAHIAEDCGASALTVHGRTREQQYSGKADWEQIALVKQAVSIPVYANGDVFTPTDAMEILRVTDCDGIAIGRGAMGNPWLFRQIHGLLSGEPVEEITLQTRVDTALRHARMLLSWKEEHVAIQEMRKHVGWYMQGMRGAARIRNEINQCGTYAAMEDILLSALEDYQ